MNRNLQILLFSVLLLILGTQAYAGDQFDHQFFSKEDGWDNDAAKTSTYDGGYKVPQNIDDCAVPMDESSVAPLAKPHRKKSARIKPKPVVLKEPDPNAPTPPGELLAKVITEETKLEPLYEPKRPSVRKVYDHRNRIPDKYFLDKAPTKENSHIPKVVFQKDFSSLLFTAIEKQDIGAISALLERGADINARTIDSGFTPLMTATIFNNEQAVSYLVIRGADLDKQNAQGKTALHLAAETGNNDILNILLTSGAKWNMKDNAGKTAVDYAAPHLKQRILVGIAEAAKDKNAALLEMVCTDSAAAVKYLLGHGANIETKNKYGDTPLLIAIKNNNLEMVHLLLANGAAINVHNLQNVSPLEIAKNNQNQPIVNVIETVAIKQELDSGIGRMPKENVMAASMAPVETAVLANVERAGTVKYLNAKPAGKTAVQPVVTEQSAVSKIPTSDGFPEIITGKSTDSESTPAAGKTSEGNPVAVVDITEDTASIPKKGSSIVDKIKSRFFTPDDEPVVMHEESKAESITSVVEARPVLAPAFNKPRSIIPDGLTD